MNEDIKEVYRDMYAAMIAKDENQLDRLHNEDFVLIHMTGMRQTKAEYIKAIINGVLNYYSAVHEDILVKVSGDTAELIGKSKVRAAVFGGGMHTWRLRLDISLINKNGRWLLNEARASTY